jgi:NET1-associated nuclear protein 1 (U3 small nucleolar RNA-associated protein 17)
MVLSTAELKPTANISGIQAHVVGTGLEIDDGVDRVGREVRDNLVLPRINAIVNPANPSRMHLAVSEGQELDPKLERTYGTPFLQTFDLGYNVSVSRQALTRTNVTHKNIAPSGRRINEPLVSHMQISTDGTWLATVDEWLPPKQDFEFLGYSGRTAEEERRRHREVFIKFWQWDAKEDTWALVSRIDTPHTLASENNGAGRVLDLVSSPTSHTFATLGEDSVVQLWTSKVRKRDGVVVRGQDGEPLRTWHCSQRMTIRNAEDSNLSQSLTHGSLSFSSDGSILAASISSPHDTSSLVHILDPTTGFIRTTYSTLSHGPITHLAILHKYLIVLSDLLTVYDLVLDTPVSSIPLFPSPPAPQLTRDQKTEMVHLAIDPSAGPTGVFAIAVPRNVDSTIRGAFSEIAVFDPRNPSEAVFGMEWPSLITALVPAVGTPGFVVVDADAEVRSVSPKASQTVVAAARPMAELGLDAAASALEEESAAGGLDVALLPDEGEAEDRDVEMVDDDGQEGDEFEKIAREAGVDGLDDDDDDDSGVRVFSQQALADALGVGRPSWALPPVEEMFYRVVDLVSGPRAVKA